MHGDALVLEWQPGRDASLARLLADPAAGEDLSQRAMQGAQLSRAHGAGDYGLHARCSREFLLSRVSTLIHCCAEPRQLVATSVGQ